MLGHKQNAPRLALGIVRILSGATLALEIIIDVGNSSILVDLSQIYHSTIGRVRDIKKIREYNRSNLSITAECLEELADPR